MRCMKKHIPNIQRLFSSIFLVLVFCNVSWSNNLEKVGISTDKLFYQNDKTTVIKITNNNDQTTFIWIGPCSLILQRYNGGEWVASPTPWSGCPLCGHAREIPHPLFLNPDTEEIIDWDQTVTWCEEGDLKVGPATGRFRFAFRYTEDLPGCRSALDPLKCWLDYRDKKWCDAYSNEFVIDKHQ